MLMVTMFQGYYVTFVRRQ